MPRPVYVSAARIILLACALAAPLAAAPSRAEKEVLARRAGFIKAINDRKTDAIAAFVAEDLIVILKGRGLSGPTAQESFRAITLIPEGMTVRSKIEKVAVKGDTAVVTAADTRGLTAYPTRERPKSVKSVETWRKIRGAWMLVEIQRP